MITLRVLSLDGSRRSWKQDGVLRGTERFAYFKARAVKPPWIETYQGCTLHCGPLERPDGQLQAQLLIVKDTPQGALKRKIDVGPVAVFKTEKAAAKLSLDIATDWLDRHHLS